MTRQYHGTTSTHGDLEGDWMIPGRGQFEAGVVYATASLAIAKSWAHAACVAHGGGPVVYVVTTHEPTVEIAEIDGDAREIGGLVHELVGEGGVGNLHITARQAARFGELVYGTLDEEGE